MSPRVVAGLAWAWLAAEQGGGAQRTRCHASSSFLSTGHTWFRTTSRINNGVTNCRWGNGLAVLSALIDVLSESDLRAVVSVLVRLVEATGAVVIVVGAILAFGQFLRALPRRDPDAFVPVRLSLGRFLALGLEFQLAGDVLRTAVAPSSRRSASWRRWRPSGPP